MPRLARDELRFLIWFALSRLPPALLRDWAGRDRLKREQAVNRAADQLLERFEGHEVDAPDPLRPH